MKEERFDITTLQADSTDIAAGHPISNVKINNIDSAGQARFTQ